MRKTQHDLPNPGMCIICRQTRVYGDEFMVETGALIDFGVFTPVNGEVLVCSQCIEDLAAVHGGLVKEADVERERADYEATRGELQSIRDELDEFGKRAVAVINRAAKLDERLAQRQAEGSQHG